MKPLMSTRLTKGFFLEWHRQIFDLPKDVCKNVLKASQPVFVDNIAV